MTHIMGLKLTVMLSDGCQLIVPTDPVPVNYDGKSVDEHSMRYLRERSNYLIHKLRGKS